MSLIPAEAIIRDLAKRHGITAQRIKLDDLAETFTRLSGEEVHADEVEQLVINLRRANIISGKKAIELLGDYLRKKLNVS